MLANPTYEIFENGSIPVMEPVISQEQGRLKKAYRPFTVNVPATAGTVSRNLDFLYVGKRSQGVDVLIRSFESGYTSNTIENAILFLRRCLDITQNLPAIIICDGALGFSQLNDFHQFISSHEELSHVPFFVDTSYISQQEFARIRKYSFVDEALFLKDYNKQVLQNKIDFWKKVKNTGNDKVNAQNILKDFVSKFSEFIKRSFDIILSLLLLIGLSPLFLLIMVAIRIESKGPLFYISKRAGRGYRIFDFYKFRTMCVDADKQIDEFAHLNKYAVGKARGPVLMKIRNDPRITKVGAFLRSCSLDELPQLVNVLKGEMSIVGNRPLPLYEATSLTTNEWSKRFVAPAGMTGLWQVQRRGGEQMSVEERIRLDITYSEKNNFLFDLWIIANTPTAVIQKNNA